LEKNIGGFIMATITKDTYYIIPNAEATYHELGAGLSTSTFELGLTLTDYEKIVTVSTTGSIELMPQHCPVATDDMWVDILEENVPLDSATKVYHWDSAVEGNFRLNVTSKESADTIKVKAYIYKYSITGTYITVPNFRDISKISYATVGDESLVYYIDMAHQDVIRHIGSTKTSTDTFWRQIQQAEIMLTAHYGVINNWELAPISKTEVNKISSQWKEQYRELIIALSGRDPFPDKDEISKMDGPYEAKISTITPSEDSYLLSTTRG